MLETSATDKGPGQPQDYKRGSCGPDRSAMTRRPPEAPPESRAPESRAARPREARDAPIKAMLPWHGSIERFSNVLVFIGLNNLKV